MFEQILDPLLGRVRQVKSALGKKIFGANNEKIDFLMDSFYKLDQTRRSAVLAGGAAGLAVIVIALLGFYFSRVSALEQELDDGFDALYRLQKMKKELTQESKRFDSLVDTIRRRSQSLAIKPYLEKTAKSVNVTLQDLSERKADLPADIVLSETVKYVNATADLSKVSIPRLLKFLIEVERSKSFLSIEDLEVRARYQDNLYFDAKVKIRGYSVER